MQRMNCSSCYCACTGCIRVVDPCPGPAPSPIEGVLVEVLAPGTSTVLASATTGPDGKACGLPAGAGPFDVRFSKAGRPNATHKNQELPCGGLLELPMPALGRVRCYGFTCNSAAGRVPTTWTFTRAGFPTVAGTTDPATGYVDLWLPAAGIWSRTVSAPDFLTNGPLNFNYNNPCANFELVLTNPGTGGSGTPVSTKFCGCSSFAQTPKPLSKMATITDSGGSTRLDISGSGNSCGGSVCVMRPGTNASMAPAMPSLFCFDNVTTFRRQLCGPAPVNDRATRPVRLSASAFASVFGGTPAGSQSTPQFGFTWNERCVEDPTGTGPLNNCSPPVMKSHTHRDARFTCAQFPSGKAWAATSYVVHSHDPPVVEFFFEYPSDDPWGPVAGAEPPPGEPLSASILLAVDP